MSINEASLQKNPDVHLILATLLTGIRKTRDRRMVKNDSWARGAVTTHLAIVG
jgi:hypothetical protein